MKTQLQWIWNDDSDCFTNFKGFPVKEFVNRCPIHYLKSLKSMNLLRHRNNYILEIEIRVDKKSSRNWKSTLKWIWNDDSDGFTNFKGFIVTGYVYRCPIHSFKSLKSMNLLRHSWRKEIEIRVDKKSSR